MIWMVVFYRSPGHCNSPRLQSDQPGGKWWRYVNITGEQSWCLVWTMLPKRYQNYSIFTTCHSCFSETVAFFAAYPRPDTIPYDANVLFSEVLINNGNGCRYLQFWSCALYFIGNYPGKTKGLTCCVVSRISLCCFFIFLPYILLPLLRTKIFFVSDMTQALECSQFPLVEMDCTTSALICWYIVVKWANSTSG